MPADGANTLLVNHVKSVRFVNLFTLSRIRYNTLVSVP